MVIHVRKNKIFKECAVFLHLIDAGVRGTFFAQDICMGFVERIILFLKIYSHCCSRGCYLYERVHETDQVKGVLVL